MAKDLGFCRVKGFGIPDAPEVEKAPAPRPVAWDDINTAEKCRLFRYIESGGEELSLTPLERTVPEMVQARRELYRTMIRRYEGALTRHFEADVATEIVAGLTTLIEMAIVQKICGDGCRLSPEALRDGGRWVDKPNRSLDALKAHLRESGLLGGNEEPKSDAAVTYPGWWAVQTSDGASFVHHNPHHDVLGGFWTEPHIPASMSREDAQRRCNVWNSIVLAPGNGLDPVQDLGRVVELDSRRRVAEEQLRQGRPLADDEECCDVYVEFRVTDGSPYHHGRVRAGQVRAERVRAGIQEVAVAVQYPGFSMGAFWVPRSRCIVPHDPTVMPIGRG